MYALGVMIIHVSSQTDWICPTVCGPWLCFSNSSRSRFCCSVRTTAMLPFFFCFSTFKWPRLPQSILPFAGSSDRVDWLPNTCVVTSLAASRGSFELIRETMPATGCTCEPLALVVASLSTTADSFPLINSKRRITATTSLGILLTFSLVCRVVLLDSSNKIASFVQMFP